MQRIMQHKVEFDRRTEKVTVTSYNPADIWPEWKGKDERWLFMSPHDDDIVCGCGITFLASLACGVETFAGVVTNGKMGYCRSDLRESISEIRHNECVESFRMLGLPDDHLFFLDFDDGSLCQQAGRRFKGPGVPGPELCGATGLQNSFTWLIRKVRPTRLFVPTITDLHSDHQMTNSEMMISIFHASGTIWPELGGPISAIPLIYEYATYSNFRTPPELRIRVSNELFEKKIDSLLAYKSQEQIESMIELQRNAGAKEFIREVRFDIFEPEECNKRF